MSCNCFRSFKSLEEVEYSDSEQIRHHSNDPVCLQSGDAINIFDIVIFFINIFYYIPILIFTYIPIPFTNILMILPIYLLYCYSCSYSYFIYQYLSDFIDIFVN